MSWTEPRSMAGFQPITYGRFGVFTEGLRLIEQKVLPQVQD